MGTAGKTIWRKIAKRISRLAGDEEEKFQLYRHLQSFFVCMQRENARAVLRRSCPSPGGGGGCRFPSSAPAETFPPSAAVPMTTGGPAA